MKLHNDRHRESKVEARALIRSVIAGMSPGERSRQSGRICEYVLALPEWKNAQAALLFRSMPGEVDTSALISAARQARMEVYLPRVTRDEMVFHLWWGEELVRHPYGMLEPSPEAAAYSAASRTIVICPGLAYDRAGHRLGRGKGYFDRFIAGLDRSRASVAGICFEQQLVESVPADASDARMDLVVTAGGVYRAGEA